MSTKYRKIDSVTADKKDEDEESKGGWGLFGKRESVKSEPRRQAEPAAVAATTAVPRATKKPTVFEGDLRLEGQANFPQGLIVRGALTLMDGAVIDGSLEVTSNLVLGRDARIPFPVIVHGNVILGPASSVKSIEATGDVHMGVNALVDGDLVCERLFLARTGDAAEKRAANHANAPTRPTT